MTELFPYLAFEKAKEAISYYEDVFGATNVKRLDISEAQAEQFGMTKEQAADATMHAEFEVLGVKILCSDSFGRVENINNGISLLIDFDVNDHNDSDKVQQFYDKIKNHDSVNIEMPLKEQFWGGKMGAFTDKYGVRWMLHGQDYTQLNS
ncbi:VOC family protein [Staphylococcus borealis]|uniref:VOC family protein n=1 Tax=Staphylococcus TaxID=1279 RepID=UPI000D1EAEC4|nr:MULTISPECIES: glyoxalase/bleomycin resistance/extradiol dioxygenase family protein [Staphylococcus]RIO91495.1 glyoxalase/bleomycin resistance/extradiol dioxygenase family protein [Staphylococcus haemolyticus]MDM7863412.1 glyoxalase/bleomycin resistance/extradiol dioxygenase family protein [Staphylococcus borealis]MDM7881964.1 glyoxalase/bleomycin resistance/extradiol dioxygenase family protein [Staphylococcus borealis]PTK68459.1 VOC family protein [Staphylococcus borealis]RIO71474.1 glyoxal